MVRNNSVRKVQSDLQLLFLLACCTTRYRRLYSAHSLAFTRLRRMRMSSFNIIGKLVHRIREPQHSFFSSPLQGRSRDFPRFGFLASDIPPLAEVYLPCSCQKHFAATVMRNVLPVFNSSLPSAVLVSNISLTVFPPRIGSFYERAVSLRWVACHPLTFEKKSMTTGRLHRISAVIRFLILEDQFRARPLALHFHSPLHIRESHRIQSQYHAYVRNHR